MINYCKGSLLTIVALLFSMAGYAQSYTILGQDGNRVITTGVPFLAITPDARSGAMGDAGAAISPDANATYWNAAKLAYLDSEIGVAGSLHPGCPKW